MDIPHNGLATPMLGMLLLTMLVQIYLFIQRIGYARAHNIDIEEFKTPRDTASLVPGPNSSLLFLAYLVSSVAVWFIVVRVFVSAL